ncbi:putative oxidoreductase YfjR [Reticulibacter mediterranei]|uniref:Putative oxidoreductase YfjR n=1 Tax=Reticulibacter mediterranei TaxID=2778369 RepID=A0A8J3N5L9_9CHLR|nr:NAD(P)-dependent oxidoreductase [Reticulibacter mediterranei]GHO96520.1 putative oxidoreductase YfjR [Reticulibacter mediterranei]
MDITHSRPVVHSPVRTDEPLGFLGLGQMGLPMARTLLHHGYKLRIFDPNSTRIALLSQEANATPVTDPSLIAFSSKIVLSMTPDDTALRQIVSELSPLLSEKSIHISLSTVSSSCTQWAAEQYRQVGRGATYLSATVLGRPPLAAQGTLTILLCGPAEAKERVLPMLQQLGTVFDIGERVDAASLFKLAINSVIVSALEAMGYATAFLQAAQLDPLPALQILAHTPLFQGVVYQEYGEMIGSDRYEPALFPVPLGLKDVELILSQAEQSGFSMPLVELARTHLLEAQRAGWNQLDWSVIGRVIASRLPTGPLPGLNERHRAHGELA